MEIEEVSEPTKASKGVNIINKQPYRCRKGGSGFNRH